MVYHAGGAGRPHPAQTALPACRTNEGAKTRRREERNASALSDPRTPGFSAKGQRKACNAWGIWPEHLPTIRRELVGYPEPMFVCAETFPVSRLLARMCSIIFDDPNHAFGAVASVLLMALGRTPLLRMDSHLLGSFTTRAGAKRTRGPSVYIFTHKTNMCYANAGMCRRLLQPPRRTCYPFYFECHLKCATNSAP